MSDNAPMVLMLDDDDDLREGLTWLLESEELLSHGFADFDAFSLALDDYYRSSRALCLLLDLRMPNMSGLEVFQWLKRKGYNLGRLPVIFLTGHGDISTAVETVKNGAFDFVEKPATDHRLIERVKQALKLSLESLEQVQMINSWEERINRLSPREREVMFLVAKGKLNKVIAADLEISMRTVEVHRSNVFDKLKVRSAAELATLLSSLKDTLGFAHLNEPE